MSLGYESAASSELAGQIKLLAIFHYVLGGLTFLCACLPFIHVTIGVMMLNGKLPTQPGQPQIPPSLGWLFIIVGSIFIAVGWAIAILMVVTGWKLQHQRSRLFCMVVAGIECVFVPLGTILGVFTLVLLAKDASKALFAPVAATPANL